MISEGTCDTEDVVTGFLRGLEKYGKVCNLI